MVPGPVAYFPTPHPPLLAITYRRLGSSAVGRFESFESERHIRTADLGIRRSAQLPHSYSLLPNP